MRIWCHRIDVLRRKANTPGNQARSGQSCWNLQHASTHDQRGSTESTWHGRLHGQVCAELDGKDNSPETTATREERLAVGSRTGKGMARHKTSSRRNHSWSSMIQLEEAKYRVMLQRMAWEPYFYRSTMEIGFQLRSSRVP